MGRGREGPGPSRSLPLQNCLRMVAIQPIPKGHEIFNTYGQMANWQLIHMYGFAEPYPDNTDDTADIQMVTMRAAALQGECLIDSILGTRMCLFPHPCPRCFASCVLQTRGRLRNDL